jgi:hypothetical protein
LFVSPRKLVSFSLFRERIIDHRLLEVYLPVLTTKIRFKGT